jgi:long-chain fatty acid transport protein
MKADQRSLSMRSLRGLCAAALLALAPSALPSRAAAGGFAMPFGPSNAGVSTTGPTSVHYNPAGLGFAKRPRLILGGSLVVGDLRYRRERRATYQRSDSLDFALPIDPDTVDPDKTGLDREVKTHPVGLLPDIYAELPILDLPLVAGFGIDTPYAAIVRWPGAGPQRFQLNDATLASVFVNAGLAYVPNKHFSVGVGAAFVLGFADISRTQDLGAVSELGQALGRPPINQPNGFGPSADPALRELDTLARPFEFNNGWAAGATFRAGLMGEIAEDLWLGASYEHETRLDFRGTFKLDMDNPFFTQDLVSQGLEYPAEVSGKASLSFTLPRVVRVGLRYGFGGKSDGQSILETAIEGSYTGWSSVKDFDVRVRAADLAQPALGLSDSLRLRLARNWRDTYGLVVRGTIRPSRVLALWGAIGGESSAVPDSTIDAASPDGKRLYVAGGLSRKLHDRVTLVLDFQVNSMFKRNVRASQYDLGNGSYVFRLFAGGAHLDVLF